MLSGGLFLANCCDFVIIAPPVFTMVHSSQTVSGEKLRKIVGYFGLAQKEISYKITPEKLWDSLILIIIRNKPL